MAKVPPPEGFAVRAFMVKGCRPAGASAASTSIAFRRRLEVPENAGVAHARKAIGSSSRRRPILICPCRSTDRAGPSGGTKARNQALATDCDRAKSRMSIKLDPRIDIGVEYIDEEVNHHVADQYHKNAPLDQGIVSCANRLDHQTT